MPPPLLGEATFDFSSLPWCRAVFDSPKWHTVPTASRQKNPRADTENLLMIDHSWNESGVSALQSFVRVGSSPSETDVGEVLQIFSLGDGMNGIEWDLPRRCY